MGCHFHAEDGPLDRIDLVIEHSAWLALLAAGPN